MPATPAWLASAEAVLNRNIAASTRAAALAKRLEGTSLQVDVDGITRVRTTCFGGRAAPLRVGDMPARHLSLLAKSVRTWARRARRTAGENIAEYLQEEGRDLVTKTEMEEFLRGVDGVRESIDRIEARLIRIEQRAARS